MSDPTFNFAITTAESIIIGIGIIANILCIIVFLRKTFRNNSISTYCIGLAICELLTIPAFITDVYNLSYNIYLPDHSNWFCKLYFYIVCFLASIQSWIMVAFSVDKLLSMRVNTIAILKKKWFQCSVVVGIVCFSNGLFLYVPILLRVRDIAPGIPFCDPNTIPFFNVHLFLYIFETTLIPFIVMTITSILTIRLLIKSRNSVANNGQVANDRKYRDRKYAISSISLNITFIILRLPLTIFYILFGYYSLYDPYFYKVIYLFYYLDMSMNFFIHMLSNSLFRREFLVLFRSAKETITTLTKNSNSNSTIRR